MSATSSKTAILEQSTAQPEEISKVKTLIAIDGSPSSEAVVRTVACRPWPENSVFCVLCAVDPYFYTKAPAMLESARESARDVVESAAQVLENEGWKAHPMVVLGNPRQTITDCAAELGVDFLFIGSHGLTRFDRFVLGSTALSVLRHAPCSVEIARARRGEAAAMRHEAMRILVATDGSQFSEAAIRSVANRPWPPGSEVKVLSAPDIVLPVRQFPYFEQTGAEEVNAHSIEHAREAVEAGREILLKTALKVHIDVPARMELAARTILAEAQSWQADLIVVGSHGRRGLDRLTLGSVSESVALHAACSVEVVRERSRQEKGSGEGEAP